LHAFVDFSPILLNSRVRKASMAISARRTAESERSLKPFGMLRDGDQSVCERQGKDQPNLEDKIGRVRHVHLPQQRGRLERLPTRANFHLENLGTAASRGLHGFAGIDAILHRAGLASA
jgi:hypothetical protein